MNINEIVERSSAARLKGEGSSNLLWFRGKVNNQFLDMLLDSAAQASCISRRCVTASPHLKDLPLFPYSGTGLVDVNGNPLPTPFEIRAPLVVGKPALSIEVTFTIVDDLPYSCIIGTNFLNKLEAWSVDNKNGLLKLNNSVCSIFAKPQHNNSVNLIAKGKTVLLSGETATISTSVKGSGMNPFRPFSDFTLLTEGDSKFEQRTKILVVPSINAVYHDNCSNIPVTVTNTSSQKASIGKGTKIGMCSEEYNFEPDVINTVVENIDPIDYLCSDDKLGHLSESKRIAVRGLLNKYRHIFSVSNSHIGRTSLTLFDLATDHIQPIADPLRRVPLQKVAIVKELLQKYKDLGLIEETDSPFRAPTVLVSKKNVADSADITDKYRLYA